MGVRAVCVVFWLTNVGLAQGPVELGPPQTGLGIAPPVLPDVPPPNSYAPVPIFVPPPAPGPSPILAPNPPPVANPLQAVREGLYLDAELGFLYPSVRNHLTGTAVFPDGSTDVLHVPQTDLSWTVAPKLALGYRLPDNQGAFEVGYRFLVSDGTHDGTASFGPASVKSRLAINLLDLDYVTPTYTPRPLYDFQFRLGVRIASVYLDTRASDDLISQQASSYFSGAGPRVGIDFERRFQRLPELSLFGRLQGAAMIGQVKQKFRESISDGTGNSVDGFLSQQRTQTAPLLNLEAGLSYRPIGPANDQFRITAGYALEQWWGIGKISGSDADVTSQGVFLRGRFDF